MLSLKRKQGQSAGLVTGLVLGVVGLVIILIIAFIIVSTLNGAGLLTSNSAEANATTNLIGNFTGGVNNVSSKIPTIFLIASVVLIMGVLSFLWVMYQRFKMGGGSI